MGMVGGAHKVMANVKLSRAMTTMNALLNTKRSRSVLFKGKESQHLERLTIPPFSEHESRRTCNTQRTQRQGHVTPQSTFREFVPLPRRHNPLD